jgi:hypothetical protein
MLVLSTPVRARIRGGLGSAQHAAFSYIGRATCVASTVLFTLGVAKVATIDDIAGIEDRAYRLHHNAGQNRTDVFSAVFGGAAAVQGPLVGIRRPMAVVGVVALGTGLGVVTHVASSSFSTFFSSP